MEKNVKKKIFMLVYMQLFLLIFVFCFTYRTIYREFVYSEEILNLNKDFYEMAITLYDYDRLLKTPLGIVVSFIAGYPKVSIKERKSQLESLIRPHKQKVKKIPI